MVRIGNVDHVLALVRGQLERMSRGKRATKSDRTGRNDIARATEKSRLQALSGLSDLPGEDFERLLVGALLSREFGEEAAQDPRFQSIIDRTWRILREDDALRHAMRELRQGAAMDDEHRD